MICSWMKLWANGLPNFSMKNTWPNISFINAVVFQNPPLEISSTVPMNRSNCVLSTRYAKVLKSTSLTFSTLRFLLKTIWSHKSKLIPFDCWLPSNFYVAGKWGLFFEGPKNSPHTPKKALRSKPIVLKSVLHALRPCKPLAPRPRVCGQDMEKFR